MVKSREERRGFQVQTRLNEEEFGKFMAIDKELRSRIPPHLLFIATIRSADVLRHCIEEAYKAMGLEEKDEGDTT